jgi:hypothetical protein
MSIKLSFESMSPWEERLESLVTLLSGQVLFRPEKWGLTEDRLQVFKQDDLPLMQETWDRYHGISFNSRKPDSYMMLKWWPECKIPGWFAMGIDDDGFFASPDNVQAFLEFATSIYQWGDMVHGYACHQQDFDCKNTLPRPTKIDGKSISTGGMDIYRCLPGIYWANFFGERYVQWFGESKLATAPCFERRTLPDGGVLLLSASTPLDYTNAKVQRRERAMRLHLGKRAFFDKAHPKRSCRSPFDRETSVGPQGQAGMNNARSNEDDIAPQPRYPLTPEDAPRTADLCVQLAKSVSGVDLDYSVESLRSLDDIIEGMREEGLTAVDAERVLLTFGCYVGEVMIRHSNAQWRKTEDTRFKQLTDIPIVVQFGPDRFANPIDKVFKRLENGKEDYLPFFYEAFVFQARAKGTSRRR